MGFSKGVNCVFCDIVSVADVYIQLSDQDHKIYHVILI